MEEIQRLASAQQPIEDFIHILFQPLSILRNEPDLCAECITTAQRSRMQELCTSIITCTLATTSISTAVCSAQCTFLLGLIHFLVSPPWTFTCSSQVWESLDQMVTWIRPRLLDLAWVQTEDAYMHFYKLKIMTVALLQHIKAEQLRSGLPNIAAELPLSFISNMLCFLCDQHPLPPLQARGKSTHAAEIIGSCLCPLCRTIFSLAAELSVLTGVQLLTPGLQHLAQRVVCQYAIGCSHPANQDASVLLALNVLVRSAQQGPQQQLSVFPGVTQPYTDIDFRRALCHLGFCPAVASTLCTPALQLLHHRLNAWVRKTKQPGYKIQPSDIQQLPFLLRISTICVLGAVRRGQLHIKNTSQDASFSTTQAYLHVFSVCFKHLAAKDTSSDENKLDKRLIHYAHLPACCQALEMLVRSNYPTPAPATTLSLFFVVHEQWECQEQGMQFAVPSLLRRISLAASLRKYLHNAPVTKAEISTSFDTLVLAVTMLTKPDNCHVRISGTSLWTIYHLRFQLAIILGITFARMFRGDLSDQTHCHRAHSYVAVNLKCPPLLRTVLLEVLHSMGNTALDRTSLQIWERFAKGILPGCMLPGCSSFDCSSTVGLAERHLQTKLCSGCRRARYCSVECQRAAWTAGHRHVCAD